MSSIDTRVLRDAFGRFLTGVTVVTTGGGGRPPSGLTANSFSSVSLDPPLILFSLACNADCFVHFAGCEHFAVNILSAFQTDLSNRFATKDIDKWASTPYVEGRFGSPLLEGALATFECRVQARHEAGDHIIYVGEVLEVRAEPEIAPLGFYRGKYCELGLP